MSWVRMSSKGRVGLVSEKCRREALRTPLASERLLFLIWRIRSGL